ncbi:hypothetical protein LOC68_11365 [Blastopirellula sp. JC732]|uniref:Uncharacterized protein n=1 Tax=Blastopirellula sediminis TaxID=2894196 RepID=A0A9X1MME5_9BACT|nr:hypothetical protein [Blastopirellula sediminis]MCC9609753.1 hypothetical protein [Blastopirellula sediminis]MCC9628997.1 hypothetical protein [Blastopirellula sediminis]
MNPPHDAITILKQARDELIARLRRRIVENEEEILSDARGESFLSDIETIYDQIASRLVHVNQMISSLPPDVPSFETDEAYAIDEPVVAAAEATYSFEATPITHQNESSPQLLSLPAPETPANFQHFMQSIQAGDVSQAGRILAELLQVEPQRGEQCASVFLQRYLEDAEIVTKAMQIRKELMLSNFNNAIMLLYECFGLQGMESIAAMQALRAML